MKPLLPIAVLLLLSGCSGSKRAAPAPLANANAVRTELYFGGRMDESAWTGFWNDVVTPRFPGFTVLDGVGFWRGRQMQSKVLVVVHGLTGADDEKIEFIRTDFKRRFHHESVLRTSVGAVFDL